MTTTAKELLEVLNSLGESALFCTAGKLTPVLPGLEVEGIGEVGVPVSAADAKRLIGQASQAPYGRGEETIVECVHRFPRRKELRQHLHQQIDAQHCDLTHVTVRTGSPQTLVCTKSQASYERRLAQFNVDTQLLGELVSLSGSESARPASPRKGRRTKPERN